MKNTIIGVNVTLRLQQCTFCGTVHLSTKDMEEHGCFEGIPQKPYRVGDIVTAHLPFGYDEHDIRGVESVLCNVSAVQSPAETSDIVRPFDDRRLQVDLSEGDLTYRKLCDVFPREPHEWVIFLEAAQSPADVGIDGAGLDFFPKAMTKRQIDTGVRISILETDDVIDLGDDDGTRRFRRERAHAVIPSPLIMEALRREANVAE